MPYDRRYSLFDFAHLENLMTSAGFVQVRLYETLELGSDSSDHSGRDLSLNVVGLNTCY